MTFKRILHNWHVKIISIILAMFLVFFTKANALQEEPVVVDLVTLTNSYYTFTESLPQRVTLMLKGEESEIQKVPVNDIVAYIDATEIREDGVYDLPVLIKQESVYNQTQKVEITVSPVSIRAKIEEKVVKYLRVESAITGIPAHGYELTSRFINPGVISVSGPREHMEKLSTIETEPVDLSGKDSNFNTRVRLNSTDPLLSFPEGEFVDFQGIIGETTVVKVIENVNIAIKDLDSSLEVTSDIPQVSVNVEGTLLSLQDFTKNNVALTINLGDITEPGEYEVPITFWTPKNIFIYDKSIDSINITVKERTQVEVEEEVE